MGRVDQCNYSKDKVVAVVVLNVVVGYFMFFFSSVLSSVLMI